MHKIVKFILLILVSLSATQVFAQLTDAETEFLATKVRENYEEYGIDGAKVYQTPKHWTLVSVVTVTSDMKTSQQSRQAQVKATRTAAEFLKGAANRSISVYDAYSTDETSLTEQQSSGVQQKNQDISSGTSTNASEKTAKSEQETMSDKIVQTAKGKIDGMQPLLKFKGEDGEIVYAYYIVISKQKAKKKR